MKRSKHTNDDIKFNENENIDNKQKKKRKGKKIKFIIVIIVIILILLGSWFGYKVYMNGGQQFNLKGVLATIVGHDEKTLANLPKIYCLVTGQSQNLTDTIMICSYDPKTQEASILSIPRDTFIGKSRNAANSYDKINALYQISPQKTLTEVNKLTGLNIEYYLNVDTEALKQIVDSIGGVYFDVPIDMDYDDPGQDLYIHMKAGYQLLDGDKAEQVLRFRHNNNGTSYPTEYGDNDIGRMKTQRNFIEAVIKKLATPSTLSKVPELIKIAEQNVTTNLDISKAKDYAPYAVEFKTENLKTAVLPGTPECLNNIWFYTQDKKETKNVIEELFGNDEDDNSQLENQNNNVTTTNNTMSTKNTTSTNNTISTKNTTITNNIANTKTISQEEKKKNSEIKIEILNGTSDSSKLNELKTTLKDRGYSVIKTGITSNTSKTMIINRTAKSNDVVSSIKKDLNNIGIISSATNNSNADITIIIGKDYE